MSDAKPTRFFRLGKLMGLLLLGLVTYLVALVIWVPAGWLWQQASGHVRLPSQVSVRQVSGTLWEGAAGLEVLGYPVRVTWGLGAPSLTGLSLPLEVRLDSVRSHLEGHLTLTWPGAGSLDARGRVDVAEFEDLIRRSGGAHDRGRGGCGAPAPGLAGPEPVRGRRSGALGRGESHVAHGRTGGSGGFSAHARRNDPAPRRGLPVGKGPRRPPAPRRTFRFPGTA